MDQEHSPLLQHHSSVDIFAEDIENGRTKFVFALDEESDPITITLENLHSRLLLSLTSEHPETPTIKIDGRNMAATKGHDKGSEGKFHWETFSYNEHELMVVARKLHAPHKSPFAYHVFLDGEVTLPV